MVDIELFPENQDLVDNYADECHKVENRALDTLCTVELPTFSFLRDLSAQKCYFILSHLRDWFGSTPSKHHCLCLIMVTDYISCSYNNTDFYGTFNKEKKDKFYESFFLKLSNEWKTMFFKIPIAVFPSMDQFISLKNILHVSFARFSKNFAFNLLLNDIMTSCDEYGAKLEKHLLNLKVKHNFKVDVDILNNSTPTLSLCSSVNNTVVRIASNSQSNEMTVPNKVIRKQANPTSIDNFMKNQVVKINSLFSTQLTQESKQTNSSASSTNEMIKMPSVIMIDDSPIELDGTSMKLGNITNLTSFKAFKRSVEDFMPLNVKDKQRKSENDIAVSHNSIKTSLPKKLNAFDILMRRKTVKTVY